jgi:hypothetical protein
MTVDEQEQSSPPAEERAYLFEMIAELAALASGRGEKAIAVMLTAIVKAYQ